MKIYITEYKAKHGVVKTEQSHTPKPAEHVIGDVITVSYVLPTGNEFTPFKVKKYEYEIVEIRQYVEEVPYEAGLVSRGYVIGGGV